MKNSFIFEEPNYVQTTGKEIKPISYVVNEVTGCWNCISHYVGKSARYPSVKRYNKVIHIHRYVWSLCNGDIPEGLVVRHKCDNTYCINPDHLELGTQADNNRDALFRKRAKTTLSEKIVAEIYTSTIGASILAKKYNISVSMIQRIRIGDEWKEFTKDLILGIPRQSKDFLSRQKNLLTEKDIIFIFTSVLSSNVLAKQFKVSPKAILKIRTKQTWRSVTDKLI